MLDHPNVSFCLWICARMQVTRASLTALYRFSTTLRRSLTVSRSSVKTWSQRSWITHRSGKLL